MVDCQPLQSRRSVIRPATGRLSEISLSDRLGDPAEPNLQIVQELVETARCYPMTQPGFKAEDQRFPALLEFLFPLLYLIH